MEEAEREEEEEGGEEEEEESPKELEPEEEEVAMAGEGLGFLRYWLCEEGVCCGEEPIRVKLNSEKMGDGSAVSRSTRSQLQRRRVFLDSCSVF